MHISTGRGDLPKFGDGLVMSTKKKGSKKAKRYNDGLTRAERRPVNQAEHVLEQEAKEALRLAAHGLCPKIPQTHRILGQLPILASTRNGRKRAIRRRQRRQWRIFGQVGIVGQGPSDRTFIGLHSRLCQVFRVVGQGVRRLVTS